MPRVFSHQWTDKKPFTRRVRWFCAGWNKPWEKSDVDLRAKDIRLEFEDADGVCNRLYGDRKADAERDFNDFRHGALSTVMLREGK